MAIEYWFNDEGHIWRSEKGVDEELDADDVVAELTLANQTIEGLRVDKDRLDWLAFENDWEDWRVIFESHAFGSEIADLRQAIDSARAEEPK